MDDPKHFERRNSDLHSFRNFGRTKSFTYGETAGPSCPPLAFAAASAAIGRRGGAGTIAEDEHEHEDEHEQGNGHGATDSSPSGPNGDSSEAEVDMSPCPRVSGPLDPQNMNAGASSFLGVPHPKLQAPQMGLGKGPAPIFGSAKTRTLGRLGFQRVASYAGTGSSGVFKQ